MSSLTGCTRRGRAVTTLLPTALSLLLLGGPLHAEDDSPTPVALDTARVAEMIERLGDPVHAVRDKAMRDLLLAGPGVIPALRASSSGDDWEISLRAREVMATFNSMLLAGARVELSVEPDRVKWNQPFSLRVRMTNPMAEPCRTPLFPQGEKGSTPGNHARQVGLLLDLADHLIVTGPSGERIDPDVYAVDDDEEVQRAVQVRAEEDAYDSLAGGASFEVLLADFNRGWAQYPMLRSGKYAVRFDYRPEWDDAELDGAGVGRVVSNTASVWIEESAPSLVLHADSALVGEMVAEKDAFIAYLTNTSSRPLFVNTNWGTRTDERAVLLWRFQTEDGGIIELSQPADSAEFSVDRIVPLHPAQRVRAASISRAEVESRLGASALKTPDAEHGFHYTNTLCRGMLSRRGIHVRNPDPALLRLYESLPPFVFFGTARCGPVPATSSLKDAAGQPVQ